MSIRGGIDLGTTYSAISWYDSLNNRVETVELNSVNGDRTLRSVVYYPAHNEPPVVGETAWNSLRSDPDRVVSYIKRSIGMAYKTAPIDGKEYTPQEVSAEILKALVNDAKDNLGEEIQDVVITVPAYFGDDERAATEEAGKIAGLHVLGLLPEPHAAALAFSIDKIMDIVDKYLLVYDLGGGTFDVTLIHPTIATTTNNAINLQIDTICKDGVRELGGLDWDSIFAEIVKEKVLQQFQVNLDEDPKNESKLMDECEKAKRHLSRQNFVKLVPDYSGHEVEVSRAEFEDRSRFLLLQTRSKLELVIQEAVTTHNVPRDKIKVLLTGGSSKMPMVREMVTDVMGESPIQHGNPELLVTKGAAYWAHLLMEKNFVSVPVPTPDGGVTKKNLSLSGLTDTAIHAVGIEVLRQDTLGNVTRCNSVIVPAGAPYGKVYEKEFLTAEDDMTEINVVLYKGDSLDIDTCEHLMVFTISGLPAGRPKGQPVLVRLSYNNNGILEGQAIDKKTNMAVTISIDRDKFSA